MDVIHTFYSIHENRLNELWNYSYICFYTFNLLNDIEKNITLRLLYGKHHIYQLFQYSEQNPLDSYCQQLKSLHLIEFDNSTNILSLNETFRKNLSLYFNENESIEQYTFITDEQIHDGMIKWEKLLNPLIDIHNKKQSLVIKYKMDSIHYKSIINHYKEHGYLNDNYVTSLGYEYMMSNPKNQVWMIINDLLKDKSNNSIDMNKLRLFIFICVKSVYGDLNISQFNDEEIQVLDYWNLIGIIHLQNGLIKSNSLIILFFGFHQDSDSLIYLNKCIIMESNYILYTYNTSEVHLSLIRLFSRVTCKLHNMCVAQITRGSIQEALSKGMDTKMIMRFIREHKHRLYDQKSNNKLIDNDLHQLNPKSFDINEIYNQIEHQLHLWEDEYNCFKYYKGKWIRNFESKENYEHIKEKLDMHNALIWFNDEKQMIFIKDEVDEELKGIIGII